MIGMRDHLIHGYDSIDLDLLSETIQEDLPKLLEKLQILFDQIEE